MEGAAVDKLILILKSLKLIVKAILHDKDSGTALHFRKKFTTPYQEITVEDWQGLGEKIRQFFRGSCRWISRQEWIDEDKEITLKGKLGNIHHHYHGDHTRVYQAGLLKGGKICAHGDISDPTIVQDLTALQALNTAIKVTAKDSKTFIHFLSSNLNESSNNLIHRATLKMNHEPRSYQGKADLALAIQNAGEVEIVEELFKAFNLTLYPEQATALKQRITKNQNQNEKKKEQEQKNKRVENKNKWKGGERKQQHASHFYKQEISQGSCKL